jgi:hypothetical protein
MSGIIAKSTTACFFYKNFNFFSRSLEKKLQSEDRRIEKKK